MLDKCAGVSRNANCLSHSGHHQAHTSVSSAATTVTNAPSTRAPATAALPVGVTVGDADTVVVDVGRTDVERTISVVDTTLTPTPDVSVDV